jgi:carboxypeptidase Q
MLRNRHLSWALTALVAVAALVGFQAYVGAQQDDPVVARIIQLGRTDNQVMRWADYASNRFGGRVTGSNAYNDATAWAVWQFRQWGIDAELDEVGEVPVGFNRGPWFGRMLKPTEKTLRFGTPTYTAGTKGIQRGPVVILKANPFSIPGRATGGQPVAKENVEKKRAAVEAAVAEVAANKGAFKGAWVLISGAAAGGSGFARDGRRGSKLPDGSPEYLDAELIPPLTRALVDAGALGTIQPEAPTAKTTSPTQAGQSEPPISMMDGYVESWDKLPVLPDIKLLDSQYNEIKAMVEKKEPVELEFDIRNWFKLGPVKYHNVVATIRGTTYPDEYIIVGGHFDCFDSATGAVDDGSGFSPGMEAIRLIKAAGARPKRPIVMMLFAAEENGLVGSQSWLKKHPEIQPKIVMMINRDGSPSAITGASVPAVWYPELEKITAPLTSLNPKWPFKLARNDYPSARPERPGGTDSSSFAMVGVPTLNFATTRDYTYTYAWHTLNDLYSELVPYTEHQQHSALVTALVAYGVANLDRPLPRDGIYLADGLYADITVGSGESQHRIMTTLDFVNAPVQTANFVRIVEGKNPQPAGAGGRPAGPGPMGPGGPGQRPSVPPIGEVMDVKGGLATGIIVSEVQKSVAVPRLPKTTNRVLKHDGAGILGVSSPNTFYLTLRKNTGLDRKYTAIGKVTAGLGPLQDVKKGDAISSIRIIRVGQAARDFKTDDEAFKQLLGQAQKK